MFRLSLLSVFVAFSVIENVLATDGIASIKSLKCKTAEEFAYQNMSCFAKSWSRTISTLNINVTPRKPVNDLFASFFSVLYFALVDLKIL